MSTAESQARLDWIILALLVGLLTFMPFAFGAVEPWSECIAIAGAALIALLLGWRMIALGGRSPVRLTVLLPVAIFILLAMAQLAPLPTRVVRMISPHTAQTKAELLSDVPGAEDYLKRMTLSFHPLATRHDVRIVLLASVIFAAVLVMCRGARCIRGMLAAMALIGGAMAALALAQDITKTAKVFWLYDIGYPPRNGTFANHSHFGQFMNLSVGAALALLLVRLRGTTTLLSDGYDSPPIQKIRQNIWWPAAVIIAGVIAAALSLTRGGMVSLILAAGFTMILLGARRGAKGVAIAMLIMLLAGFTCILYFGFDHVHDRVVSLTDVKDYRARWQPAIDIAHIFRLFPITGTGLGTHEMFFPRFRAIVNRGISTHAENEYAQVAEEMGGIGVICVAMFVGVVWLHFARGVRRSDSPTAAAVSGLGCGLLAVMIHSLVDFGQHVPAVAGFSAATCALMINAARVDQIASNARISVPRGALSAGVVVLAIVVGCWALIDARATQRARAEWDGIESLRIALQRNDWNGTNDEYALLISTSETAAAIEPENILYRYWLNVFRWHSISRARDPQSAEIVLTPQAIAFTERIVDELHRARPLCPTYGANYTFAGQLEMLALDRPVGERHIQQGFALAPNDFDACFLAGLIDGRRQRWDACQMKFRRALVLNPGLFRKIITVYVRELDRPQDTLALVGDDPYQLLRLSSELNGLHESSLAQTVKQRAIELLQKQCAQPNADPEALATLASLEFHRGNNEACAELYARALERQYGRVFWHVERARALVKLGRLSEASAEADLCIRMDPNANALSYLLSELDEAVRRKR